MNQLVIRIRNNIYALEAIGLSTLAVLFALFMWLVDLTTPPEDWAIYVLGTLMSVFAFPLITLFIWGLYLFEIKAAASLPLGCLMAGMIALSLAYGIGIIIVVLVSLFDLNRLIMVKLLYTGDAPVEYFWSPGSRREYAIWKSDHDLNTAKQNLNSLVESRDATQLLNILQTGNWKRKTAAAEALGILGAPEAVEPLVGVLRHRPADISAYTIAPKMPLRVEAAIALGQIGDAKAVEPLIDVLQNKGVAATVSIFMYPVQAAAATALGQLGDSRAIEPLLAVIQHQPTTGNLQQQYKEVRRTAESAVAKLR
jgi:hypothetical protein